MRLKIKPAGIVLASLFLSMTCGVGTAVILLYLGAPHWIASAANILIGAAFGMVTGHVAMKQWRSYAKTKHERERD